MLYSFSAFSFAHFMSVRVNGYSELAKENFIILLVCVGLIELLNQITYWMGKKNVRKAIILKVICFWLIFSLGIACYIFLLSNIEPAETPLPLKATWHKSLWYLVWSFYLPIYSLRTDIRFLCLTGKFKKTAG